MTAIEKLIPKFDVHATDVSGQRSATVRQAPADATIEELVRELGPKLKLPEHDSQRRRLAYHALLEREQRHLLASERVGDALEPGDRLTLEPTIEAGSRSYV